MLDTVRQVHTPELVALHLRLAGAVPRALAWMLDALVRIGIAAIGGSVLGWLGGFGWGLTAILYFLLEWFYPVSFEVLGDGATPGKRALGLVVCHDDGTPIGWGRSVTRNLLRVVDFLPFAYGIGVTTMLLSREFRRVGDVLAGTVVVYRDEAVARAVPEAAPFAPAGRLSREAQRAALAFAERVPQLTPARAEELAALAPQLTGGEPPERAVQRLLGLANHLIGRRP